MIKSVFVAVAALLITAPLVGVSADNAPAVRGSAGNSIATITVDAHNIGRGTAATGWFSATGSLLPGVVQPADQIGAFHFEGPVTCLDIEGNRAGLIYPVQSATGTLAQHAKGFAIYVTIVDNGPGRPTQVGFVGPAPVNDLHACPPTITFLTGTSGRIVIKG